MQIQDSSNTNLNSQFSIPCGPGPAVGAANTTGLVSAAAAELNGKLRARGLLSWEAKQWRTLPEPDTGLYTLSMRLGVRYWEDNDIFLNEIENAFEMAKNANGISPQTVSGLIFDGNYVNDLSMAKEMSRTLGVHRERAKGLGLEIGVRLRICTNLLSREHSEAK